MNRRRPTPAEQAQARALVEVLAPGAMPARIPTGRIDEQVTVGVDRTASVPLLILTLMRRSPSDVAEAAFRPVHTITLETQYAELLLERITETVRLFHLEGNDPMKELTQFRYVMGPATFSP